MHKVQKGEVNLYKIYKLSKRKKKMLTQGNRLRYIGRVNDYPNKNGLYKGSRYFMRTLIKIK